MHIQYLPVMLEASFFRSQEAVLVSSMLLHIAELPSTQSVTADNCVVLEHMHWLPEIERVYIRKCNEPETVEI